MPTEPLIAFDFAAARNGGTVAVCPGAPTALRAVTGFASQTGGGPCERVGDPPVAALVTRQFGTHYPFVWLALARPTRLDVLSFHRWHTHTKGAPAGQKYRVQLQLDSGGGFADLGDPFDAGAKASGTDVQVAYGRVLPAGTHCIRWVPQKLKGDTGADYFALGALELHGQPLDAPAAELLQPKGGFLDVTINGARIEKLKVMEAKYAGTCALTGARFAAGASVAFKHRDALTPEQAGAIFGAKKPAHLTVLVPGAPAPLPPVPKGCVRCAPDPAVLVPFNGAMPDGRGFAPHCTALSCGRVLPVGQTATHIHDAEELERCRALAHEAAQRLQHMAFNTESRHDPIGPYFVAAEVGAKPRATIDVYLVRELFDALALGGPFELYPLSRTVPEGLWLADAQRSSKGGTERTAWAQFYNWFTKVPGLRGHSQIVLWRDAEDEWGGGAEMPLFLALTAAGSLVGAGGYVLFM